jgi:hypothetical protein
VLLISKKFVEPVRLCICDACTVGAAHVRERACVCVCVCLCVSVCYVNVCVRGSARKRLYDGGQARVCGCD